MVGGAGFKEGGFSAGGDAAREVCGWEGEGEGEGEGEEEEEEGDEEGEVVVVVVKHLFGWVF